MKTYYEKANVKIAWDEDLNCVYVIWQGFGYGEEVRTAMNKALQLLKEKGTGKALVNLQKFRITSQEDQEWMEHNWLPRAIAAGLKYTAYIVPQSALGKASFEESSQKLEPHTEAAYFDNEEEARQWLRSLK